MKSSNRVTRGVRGSFIDCSVPVAKMNAWRHSTYRGGYQANDVPDLTRSGTASLPHGPSLCLTYISLSFEKVSSKAYRLQHCKPHQVSLPGPRKHSPPSSSSRNLRCPDRGFDRTRRLSTFRNLPADPKEESISGRDIAGFVSEV